MSIETFVIGCDTLLQGELTPLQKSECAQYVRDANAYLKDASCQSKEAEEDLSRQRQRIEEHWKEIFGEFNTKAFCFMCMGCIEDTFTKEISAEYLDRTWPFPEDVRLMVGKGYLEAYVKEMMLDQDHAAFRMKLIGQRKGQAPNNVQFLANEERWDDLATLITGDRILGQQILLPVLEIGLPALMSKTELKYAEQLKGRSGYTPSASVKQQGRRTKEPVEEERRPLLAHSLTQSIEDFFMGSPKTSEEKKGQ